MFASTERVELAAIWDELIAGTCKVESWSHGESTWSLVVSRGPNLTGVRSPGLRHRDIEVLEQALLCGVRKLVAVEAGLSCSSIAVILQGCFHFMGLSCLPSRIPGLLVAAAHARHHLGSHHQYLLRGRTERQFSQQTVTVPRPDVALKAWLAPAEHAVLNLLVEGYCYAEISEARHTSIRTVANQVASGFRRLGVSGRAELLCMLARWGLEEPELPERRPPAVLPTTVRRAVSRRLGVVEEAGSRPHCLSPSPAT
jgi:DNA-binding CsgD family transcriptional regulator